MVALTLPEPNAFRSKGYEINFEKQSLENTTYSFEYDYKSIMHYGGNYFRLVRVLGIGLSFRRV